MVTDEQLIERLSSSMDAATADVYPRPGLLGPAAVQRPRRFSWPSPGGLAAVVATTAALAVALLAIVLLGRGRTHSAPPTPTVPATARPATTVPGLRAELAILRRPQRSSDRLPAWQAAVSQRQRCSACLTVGTLMPAQTRLLATISRPRGDSYEGRRERIYLVVGTIPRAWQNSIASGWRQPGNAGSGVHLSLVGFTNRRTPGVQPADTLINDTQRGMPAAALTPRDVMVMGCLCETIGVVPDNVARVRWELANPGQRRAAVVYPRLRGNVAIAPWTPAPRSTSLINEQWLVGATWYDAHGRVIANFHQSLARLDPGRPK